MRFMKLDVQISPHIWEFSAIISLDKLSKSFSLWDSNNAYIISFGGLS